MDRLSRRGGARRHPFEELPRQLRETDLRECDREATAAAKPSTSSHPGDFRARAKRASRTRPSRRGSQVAGATVSPLYRGPRRVPTIRSPVPRSVFARPDARGPASPRVSTAQRLHAILQQCAVAGSAAAALRVDAAAHVLMSRHGSRLEPEVSASPMPATAGTGSAITCRRGRGPVPDRSGTAGTRPPGGDHGEGAAGRRSRRGSGSSRRQPRSAARRVRPSTCRLRHRSPRGLVRAPWLLQRSISQRALAAEGNGESEVGSRGSPSRSRRASAAWAPATMSASVEAERRIPGPGSPSRPCPVPAR